MCTSCQPWKNSSSVTRSGFGNHVKCVISLPMAPLRAVLRHRLRDEIAVDRSGIPGPQRVFDCGFVVDRVGGRPAGVPGRTGAGHRPARMQVTADVGGSSFYEVTFYARAARGGWAPIGTDDTAPYRVFHDVSGLHSGTKVQYRAVVLDNAGHTATQPDAEARVPAPAADHRGARRGQQRPRHRRGARGRRPGARHPRGPLRAQRRRRHVDARSAATTSSPGVHGVRRPGAAQPGRRHQIRYRAILAEPDGTRVTSAVRTVRYAGPPLAVATLHYFRPAGDYTGWGLHLWGDGIDPAVLAQIAWDRPWPPTRIEDGWAEYDIPLVDDTKPVNFIMHLPNGDTVPTSREPGGDRSFTPIDHPQVWIKQGDATVYTSPPATG